MQELWADTRLGLFDNLLSLPGGQLSPTLFIGKKQPVAHCTDMV